MAPFAQEGCSSDEAAAALALLALPSPLRRRVVPPSIPAEAQAAPTAVPAVTQSRSRGPVVGGGQWVEKLEMLQKELLDEFDRIRTRRASRAAGRPECTSSPQAESVYEAQGQEVAAESGKAAGDEAVLAPTDTLGDELAAELAAARAAAAQARGEIVRLFEAASAEGVDVADLWQQRDAVEHALAEAELEKRRQAAAWDLLRSSVDVNTFASITRRVAGCDKDDRALPVDVARRIFEGSATFRENSRPSAPCGPRPGIAASQSRAMRLRRDFSRDQKVAKPEAKGSTKANVRSSSMTSLPLPRKPQQGSRNGPCAAGADASAACREDSPSVRDRILAFER